MSEGKRALETVNRGTYTEVVQGNTVRKIETFPRQSDPEVRERIIRNRERSRRMNMAYVVFLTAASVLCVFFCVMFLQLQTISTSLQKELMRNQTELKELKMENDTVYNEIVASVDLEKVRETAMNRFGMAYPKEDQIVYFKSVSKDYVRQYAEIPESTIR